MLRLATTVLVLLAALLPSPAWAQESPMVVRVGAYINEGKFNTKLPLADYPFDEQELTEFEDSGLDESGLRYIPDDGAVATNPQMTLPGYNIGRPNLEVVSYPYATRFGERAGPFPTYSRARVVLGSRGPRGPTQSSCSCRSSSCSCPPGSCSSCAPTSSRAASESASQLCSRSLPCS